jgi:tetratricopeptide (TPR) repeat protein
MKKTYILVLSAAVFLLTVQSISAGSVVPDPEAAYSRALLLKTEGNYSRAIEEFTALLNSGMGTDRLYYQIATCYSSLADYAKAQSFARKSISADTSYIEPYQLIYSINMTLKNHEAAADILEDLTEANPSEIQYQFTKGSLYYQNLGNYLMAEASLRKVLDIAREKSVPSSYSEQAHLLLSEIALQQKDYPAAISELDEAVQINPRNNARYYRLASYFISASSLDSAKLALERFLPTVSADQRSNILIQTMYAYLGNIYYITDDPRALEYLRIGAGSDNIDCFTAKYVFYAATGQTEEAAPILEKVMSEYPKYVTPSIALGRIYLEKGNTEKAYDCFLAAAQLLFKTDMPSAAIEYYRQALRLKPETAEIHLILGQLYETLNQNSAAALHYIAYNTVKPDAEILLHLAYLYDLSGNTGQSDYYMAKAEAGYPESSRVPFFKGVLATKADRSADALKSLKKAISLKNSDHTYYFYLALCNEKLNNFDGAIDSMKKAIDLDPDNASYMNFLGYLYADRNVNLDQAETLLSKALAKEPSNGAFLDSLGWTFYRQGKFDAAVIKLNQARRALAAENKFDPVVFTHLGDAYFGAGNKVKAAEAWKRSLELKNDPAIRRKIDSIK